MHFNSVQLITEKQKTDYKLLAEANSLEYEENKFQLGIYDGSRLIAGISLDDNCIKLLIVDDDYRGYGLSSILITDVIKYAFENGITHIFAYTKPSNAEMFHSLNFYTIFETEEVLFLENNRNGIKSYCDLLEKKKVVKDKVCGLVMNFNPITLGHEYLIQKASEENDIVHVIIVKEDKSVFPYEVRLRLLNEVTKKYPNVVVHEGSSYVISSATFPTYFLKSKGNIPSIYAKLDVNLFGKYIAPALGINRRYIGEEPYSETTKMYNEVIQELLPKYGIEVTEIPRKKFGEDFISASKVRNMIKEGEFDKLKNFLPESSYNFLMSEEGSEIISKIKVSKNRH